MAAFWCADRNERERWIGIYVRPVADELRSLDLDLLVRHISSSKMGNLTSVVEASSELYFKEGTLRCSQVGETDLNWAALPQLRIALTFVSEGVTAAFVLHLGAYVAGIELQFLSFPRLLSTKSETKLLRRALENARRKKETPEEQRREHRIVKRVCLARLMQV